MQKKIIGIIVDIICMTVSYLTCVRLRFGWLRSPLSGDFSLWGTLLLFVLAYAVMNILMADRKERSDRRTVFSLMRNALLDNVMLTLLIIVIVYLIHTESKISRGFVISFAAMDTLLMILGHLVANAIFRSYLKKWRKKLVIVANRSNYRFVLNRILEEYDAEYEMTGLMIADRTADGFFRICYDGSGRAVIDEKYRDFDEFLKKGVVDEVFMSLPDSDNEQISQLIERLESMGIDSFLTINTFSLGVEEARMENFSKYHVLRFSPRVFSDTDFVMKRILDILGGLVGCILCLIVGLFVAPAIYIEDPGPVIFKQQRVGRNGRRFTMYKFRSMYQDAEERKKELMAQNEMDGLMFKMKDDPRITKVGKFIRKTSLDEFPQFFNVLMGDMSLVGTRPPTVGEFEMYENHHKRRLSLKPGITGLWQVSGRSEITDFEDVVKLDLEYIDRWSFLFDVQILFRTVAAVFEAKGSE